MAERRRRIPVERLNQAVARKLGSAILGGTHAPGAGLGGEIEAAEALGVSRTVYREAIRILVAKGLVESRPRAGTHVTPRSRWNLLDPDILAWVFSGEGDARFTRDLFELRRIIEPAAAALAATRRQPEHVTAMREALAVMARRGLADDLGQAADQQFHRTILAAADNLALTSLTDSVGAAVSWTTRFKQRRQGTPRDPIDEHRAVADAIAAGDAPAASAAMTVLIDLALKDMHPGE